MDALRRFNGSVAGLMHTVNKEATDEEIVKMDEMTFGGMCCYYCMLLEKLSDEILDMPMLDVLEKSVDDPDFLEKHYKDDHDEA